MRESQGNPDELSFEEALAQLEEIVSQLEDGEVELEEAIRLYERGAALRKRCSRKLEEAKMRIESVVADGAAVEPADSLAGKRRGSSENGGEADDGGDWDSDDIPF